MAEPVTIQRCYKCKEPLEFEVKIGRRDQCPNCYAYLHCCYNCEHWDPGVHNECRESTAEFVRDRAEGNFCLYFTFKRLAVDDPAGQAAAQARAELDALFGSGPPKAVPKSPDEARARLDALFGGPTLKR